MHLATSLFRLLSWNAQFQNPEGETETKSQGTEIQVDLHYLCISMYTKTDHEITKYDILVRHQMKLRHLVADILIFPVLLVASSLQLTFTPCPTTLLSLPYAQPVEVVSCLL